MCNAPDLTGLLDPSVTFFSYRVSGTLLGVGALKELDTQHSEVKLMHTAQEARGRGIGRAMLGHLLTIARDRGYLRMSLETGTMPAFAAARALVRERRVHAVRAVRRLNDEAEQHLDDARAILRRPRRDLTDRELLAPDPEHQCEVVSGARRHRYER
jgi:predicted GNAT family acetyltransferase